MRSLNLLSPLNEQIVLMGMSCVGKTEFAELLKSRYGYKYYSFDAQFDYRKCVLPGFSHRKSWQKIIQGCEGKFVLDNWSTEDTLGQELYRNKPEICLIVVFDEYSNILKRYRVPVKGEDAHSMMFEKMYKQTPFVQYQRVRYLAIKNEGYQEYNQKDFQNWASNVSLNLDNLQFDQGKWTWHD